MTTAGAFGERAQPRQGRAASTRSAILASGRALVRARGHSGWTLRDVARGAPCSPAAIYRYFEDRDALLAALVEELNDALVNAVADAAVSAPPSLDGIADAFVSAVLDVYARDPSLAGPLLALPARLGAWRVPALPPELLALVEAAVSLYAPRALRQDPRVARRLVVAGQAIIAARHRADAPTLEVTARVIKRLALTTLGAPAAPVSDVAALAGKDAAGFAVRERAPTRRDAQPGYDACLIAAAELFAARGVAGATTAMIAERAGVSTGSLYRFFPTKGALCAALAVRVNDAFAERARTALAQAQDVSAAIDGVIEAAAHTIAAHAELLAALAQALVTPPFIELPPIPASLVTPTRDAIARDVTAFFDPGLAAFVVLHAAHALCLDALVTDGSLDDAAASVRRIVAALLAPGATD